MNSGESIGPMQYGTTYSVRPLMQPVNSASILACASAGRHPVVVRAGVFAVARADESQVLDAGDVGRTGAVQITIRVGGLVELDKIAAAKHRFDQCRVFGVRPGAPVNRIRLGQSRDLLDPTLKRRIRRAHLNGKLQVWTQGKTGAGLYRAASPSHCSRRRTVQ